MGVLCSTTAHSKELSLRGSIRVVNVPLSYSYMLAAFRGFLSSHLKATGREDLEGSIAANTSLYRGKSMQAGESSIYLSA